MKVGWDGVAFLILTLEVVGWFIAEIGGLKGIGYGLVILFVVILFIHLARFPGEMEGEGR